MIDIRPPLTIPEAADHFRGRPLRPLTVEEVADVYNRPVSFVRAWIDSGRLPHIRLSSRTIRVAWRDVVDQYCGVPSSDLEHPDITMAKREAAGAPCTAPPLPASFVYFVEAKGANMLKIGFTGDVRRRVTDLRNMSGAPVELLAAVPGNKAVEQRLHRCFQSERQHGEWFAMSARLMRFVKSVQTLGRLPERWPRTA